MAWYGTRVEFGDDGLRAMLIYWGVFLLFLLATLYLALLDIRYVWMEYRMGERELFEDTLGSDDLREALAERRARREDSRD